MKKTINWDYVGVGIDRKCAICGKPFLVQTEDWVFKRKRKRGGTAFFCSWSCMKVYDEAKPVAGRKRNPKEHEIIAMIREGWSQTQIAQKLGVPVTTVTYYRDMVREAFRDEYEKQG